MTDIKSIALIVRGLFEGRPIKKAFLFGSFARNEQGPESDVDILLVLEEGHNLSLLDFAGLHIGLEKHLRRKVDCVTDKALSKHVRAFVERDKQLIYEKTDRK